MTRGTRAETEGRGRAKRETGDPPSAQVERLAVGVPPDVEPEPRGTGRRSRSRSSLPWLVPAVWVGGLLPVVVLGWDALTGALGANPVQRATLQTGLLTLALLLLSLACTPLRLLTGWTWPARIRRALGLLASLYGALHFLIYLYDHGFTPAVMLEDVLERPFVTVGFLALLLLMPLALTSTPASVRRLGFRAWTRLHRLVYVAAGLGALHYFWGVKQDRTAPVVWAAVLLGLLLARLVRRR